MVGIGNPLLPENQLFQPVKILWKSISHPSEKTLKIYQVLFHLSRYFLIKFFDT